MLVLLLLFIPLPLQGVIVSHIYNTIPVVYSSLYFTLLYFTLQNTILIVIVVHMYSNHFKNPFQTQCYSMWLQNARQQIKQLFETNKFVTLYFFYMIIIIFQVNITFFYRIFKSMCLTSPDLG